MMSKLPYAKVELFRQRGGELGDEGLGRRELRREAAPGNVGSVPALAPAVGVVAECLVQPVDQ